MFSNEYENTFITIQGEQNAGTILRFSEPLLKNNKLIL